MPCPPFLHGVVVGPGMNWFANGFDVQNSQMISGTNRLVLGRAVRPNDETMQSWAEYIPDSFSEAHGPHGGWAPGRSHEVAWGSIGPDREVPQGFFYKAFDNGHKDLVSGHSRRPSTSKRASRRLPVCSWTSPIASRPTWTASL